MIIPERLEKGDEIRVIAPSRSLSLVSKENIKLAENNLKKMGFNVSYSKNCFEKDMFISSSIESRVSDIHDAFRDKDVKCILTAIGGFNSNQLLNYLDYDLIKNNPKILCGYSDITALANAIYAKTGLITYIGPHFSTFGMIKESEYNEEYFLKAAMDKNVFEIKASSTWSDDAWYINQDKRILEKNNGYLPIHEGEAEGKIIGGNLGTLNLLFGTNFMPGLAGSIIFIEDDAGTDGSDDVQFDRELQSLLMQPNAGKIKAIVIGRFQKKSNMTPEKIRYIIDTKKELKNIPVLANANFGHANPIFTFPMGEKARIMVGKESSITLLKD
jgi:muramoyltetrapeptide carboxypeptidase LdcA involved in peptidoglycan recycling